MDKLKSLCKRLLYPHPALIIILSLISVGAMIPAMILLGDAHPVTCAAYALSAYSLTVVCVRIPDFVKFCERLKQNNAFLVRWFGDERFRVKSTLLLSLIVNGAYTALQLGLAVWHSSVWYYSLFAYYALLVLMRAFLLHGMGSLDAEDSRRRQLLRYRFCGAVLLPMNLTLSGITLYIVGYGYGMRHHFITTIALAAFTFYSLTMAIISVVKYRKYNSPLLSASKAVSLISASVSMLTLETAMLAAFGTPAEESFRKTVTALTGAAVFAFTLAVSIYMLARASRLLRELDSENKSTLKESSND